MMHPRQPLYLAALALVLLLAMGLVGCTYNATPVTAPAVNVYSSYDDPVSGQWVLVVDDSVNDANRNVKPSSYACSAHDYPLQAGDTLRASISRSMESIFEEVEVRSTAPSNSALKEGGYAGVILVRLDHFQPRVTCNMGFFSANCTATTDISFGVNVRGPEGRLYGGTAGANRSAQGDAGGTCQEVATWLSESARLSIREGLERLVEKLANSERIRNHGEPQAD